MDFSPQSPQLPVFGCAATVPSFDLFVPASPPPRRPGDQLACPTRLSGLSPCQPAESILQPAHPTPVVCGVMGQPGFVTSLGTGREQRPDEAKGPPAERTFDPMLHQAASSAFCSPTPCCILPAPSTLLLRAWSTCSLSPPSCFATPQGQTQVPSALSSHPLVQPSGTTAATSSVSLHHRHTPTDSPRKAAPSLLRASSQLWWESCDRFEVHDKPRILRGALH